MHTARHPDAMTTARLAHTIFEQMSPEDATAIRSNTKGWRQEWVETQGWSPADMDDCLDELDRLADDDGEDTDGECDYRLA